ncbi:CAAX amino terminal protease family protein [Methanosarcina siciliae C2J]|uniref:CAAX amino terminal protease family protein n=3 Tax=Methanosarcina siciliae TaxID=38027 RepID=A0A0E3PII2_9EURY|nr:type II CAAX endopeptidase family protein [Methanosarcina siciliae]AKB30454.1 CAAX amino terminal protease family protein [Methanosarcina siciliae T4/M]AKB34369.1 CAAX amino terminal protease family protein [Methanosarcina siciliae HI350]AKB38733.1 CAAX amino terminal protease family protein [Methanosarcina siciliae C2J]
METYEVQEMEIPENREKQKPGHLGMYIPEYGATQKSDLRNKGFYLIIPILSIALAELMIYFGMIIEAMEIHAIILLGLTISMLYIENEEIQKTYQALILLPVLRLVNLSMPAFYDVTLYSFVFTYGLLTIPVTIAITSQGFTREQLGVTFRRMWLYIPLSIIISFLLGIGEYLIIETNYLIPDLSISSLLVLILIMVFLVGLIEELIFRSIIQNRLEVFLGSRRGLVITSILFGLMQSGYGSISEIFYTFAVGFIIGYMFYRTRSLPLVTMIHGFINVFLFGVFPHLL